MPGGGSEEIVYVFTDCSEHTVIEHCSHTDKSTVFKFLGLESHLSGSAESGRADQAMDSLLWISLLSLVPGCFGFLGNNIYGIDSFGKQKNTVHFSCSGDSFPSRHMQGSKPDTWSLFKDTGAAVAWPRKRTFATACNRLRMGSGAEEQVAERVTLETSDLRKFGLFGFWLSFILYAIFVAPNGDSEVQQSMLKALIAPPPWEGANPIFASLFILLGVWPAVYAALLLPLKPVAQKLPAWPFVAASFGLGAFALTPYLALTSYTQGQTESDSGAARFFGSTGMGIYLLLNTAALLLFALGVFAPNDINGGSDYPIDVIFYTYLRNFGELFASFKLVNVPSCDFLALWALSSKPLLEDMRRRGWYRGGAFDTALFASLMLAPLVGACTWLVVRPPLPQSPAGAPAGEADTAVEGAAESSAGGPVP